MTLRWSEEARAARERQTPLVALETSVVAQGLPYPHNLQAARACEEAIRRAGATPAAIAVVRGEIHVGLEAEALRLLAEGGETVWKIGSRDLPIARARFEALDQGGIVFALPPPAEEALPREELELHLTSALNDAEKKGVRGKAVTPFLLAEIARRTQGRSLRTNLALLVHNARFAADLAVAVY